jgi:hypothetical protein
MVIVRVDMNGASHRSEASARVHVPPARIRMIRLASAGSVFSHGGQKDDEAERSREGQARDVEAPGEERREGGPGEKQAARRPKPAPRKVARRPSVTLPALPEIEGYVRSLPPPVVPLVNRLRKLVRAAAPEAVELLDASGPAYDVNGLFARIETAEGVVRVRFMKADRLEAPAGVLADDATVSVTTFEELRENVLSSLVRQAVLLNVREPGSGAV